MNARISDALVEEAMMVNFARTVMAQHTTEDLQIEMPAEIKQIYDSLGSRTEKSYERKKVEFGMRTPQTIEEMKKAGTKAKELLSSTRIFAQQKNGQVENIKEQIQQIAFVTAQAAQLEIQLQERQRRLEEFEDEGMDQRMHEATINPDAILTVSVTE